MCASQPVSLSGGCSSSFRLFWISFTSEVSLFRQRLRCAGACWLCSGKGWKAVLAELGPGAVPGLIAAAPPLEEMALVLPAWSCVHQLQRGSLPTDIGIHGVEVLPVGLASPASMQGGPECCTCGKKQWCWAGRDFWLIPGRLVCRSPRIFFGWQQAEPAE